MQTVLESYRSFIITNIVFIVTSVYNKTCVLHVTSNCYYNICQFNTKYRSVKDIYSKIYYS